MYLYHANFGSYILLKRKKNSLVEHAQQIFPSTTKIQLNRFIYRTKIHKRSINEYSSS